MPFQRQGIRHRLNSLSKIRKRILGMLALPGVIVGSARADLFQGWQADPLWSMLSQTTRAASRNEEGMTLWQPYS
jgi:hypothetical protein